MGTTPRPSSESSKILPFRSLFRLFQFHKNDSPADRQLKHFLQEHFAFKAGDLSLYRQAFTHSSALDRGLERKSKSNERLEFLGDAILDSIVADYLYRNFLDRSEGELTKMKSKIVSRRTLNQLGSALQIEDLIVAKLGKQPMQQTLVGNALEALIGAIYLDQGYAACEKAVLQLLEKHQIDERLHDTMDFKSKLHEWCQKERKNLKFTVQNDMRENVPNRYTIAARVDNEVWGTGVGKSKKSAEQVAAEMACKRVFPEMK